MNSGRWCALLSFEEVVGPPASWHAKLFQGPISTFARIAARSSRLKDQSHDEEGVRPLPNNSKGKPYVHHSSVQQTFVCYYEGDQRRCRHGILRRGSNPFPRA